MSIRSGTSACVSVGELTQSTLGIFSFEPHFLRSSARLTECSTPPSSARVSASGLITRPQSCASPMRLTQTRPVRRLTSTSTISATTVSLRYA